MENDHAKGNESRSLLPEAQEQAREVERRSDLPIEHGAIASDGQTSEVKSAEVQGKAPRKPAYLTVNESEIQRALIEARGDIFVASQLLEITPVRLDRAIGVSEILRATVEELRSRHPTGSRFQSVDEAEIRTAIDRRLSLYRVTGLDALAELACLPVSPDNSAQNQVKLAAAARLAGGTETQSGAGELADTLRQLRDEYQANAPRLKVTRERMTVEVSGPNERVVSSQEHQQ